MVPILHYWLSKYALFLSQEVQFITSCTSVTLIQRSGFLRHSLVFGCITCVYKQVQTSLCNSKVQFFLFALSTLGTHTLIYPTNVKKWVSKHWTH